MYFNIVFIMVISSLLVQGWTVGLTARMLNMLEPPEPGLVDRVELDLPGGAELELVGYRIHPESAVAQGQRVPRWARPVLIMRGDRHYNIHSAGPLLADDQVYLFASPKHIATLDDIYATPGDQHSKHLMGDFLLDGKAPMAQILKQYGLPGAEDDAAMTLSEYIRNESRDEILIGDRLPLGPVELVVASLDSSGGADQVGLVIDPADRPISGAPPKAYRFIVDTIEMARNYLSRARNG